MGKPGSDAGMPGIEDSEVGKIDDVQFGKQWSKTLKSNSKVGKPSELMRKNM